MWWCGLKKKKKNQSSLKSALLVNGPQREKERERTKSSPPVRVWRSSRMCVVVWMSLSVSSSFCEILYPFLWVFYRTWSFSPFSSGQSSLISISRRIYRKRHRGWDYKITLTCTCTCKFNIQRTHAKVHTAVLSINIGWQQTTKLQISHLNLGNALLSARFMYSLTSNDSFKHFTD